MSLMQALLQRLLPLFGGLFASQVETGIVLEQAEQLDAIEERARQFESEGKPELADALRQQITRIYSDDPGRKGLSILANLESQSQTPPLLTSEADEPEEKPKRRTRRSAPTHHQKCEYRDARTDRRAMPRLISDSPPRKEHAMEPIILDTLARRVRLATVGQLATIVATVDGEATASRRVRRCLQRLEEEGCIVASRLALKIVELEHPLFRWHPGDLFNEADRLAWRAAKRVTQTKPRRCTIYRVTREGARRCGSGGNVPQCQPTQIEHDLGCTAMLIAVARHNPTMFHAWVGEDEIRRSFRPLWPATFRKVPDAVLVRQDDRVERFLEFCGQYSASGSGSSIGIVNGAMSPTASTRR